MADFIDPRLITGNKAVIQKEEMDLRELKTQHSQVLLKRIGAELTPPKCKLLGSVALHIYEVKDEKNEKSYTTIEQLQGLRAVPEGLADFGLKQLRTAMMGAYGHKPPRTVKG